MSVIEPELALVKRHVPDTLPITVKYDLFAVKLWFSRVKQRDPIPLQDDVFVPEYTMVLPFDRSGALFSNMMHLCYLLIL